MSSESTKQANGDEVQPEASIAPLLESDSATASARDKKAFVNSDDHAKTVQFDLDPAQLFHITTVRKNILSHDLERKQVKLAHRLDQIRTGRTLNGACQVESIGGQKLPWRERSSLSMQRSSTARFSRSGTIFSALQRSGTQQSQSWDNPPALPPFETDQDLFFRTLREETRPVNMSAQHKLPENITAQNDPTAQNDQTGVAAESQAAANVGVFDNFSVSSGSSVGAVEDVGCVAPFCYCQQPCRQVRDYDGDNCDYHSKDDLLDMRHMNNEDDDSQV